MSNLSSSEKMNINLLYVVSCFAGGGFNITIPYFTLLTNEEGCVIAGRSKPSFTIIVGSLTDSLVFLNLGAKCYLYSFDPKESGRCNLNEFFKHVDNKKFYRDEELRNMLRPITPRSMAVYTEKGGWQLGPNITALPKIYFPGTDKFKLLELDERVGILTEEEAVKYAREQTEIVFKHKDVVALYPADIKAPLKIEQGMACRFGITVMEPGPALIKISQLSFDLSFHDLLLAFAFGQGAAFSTANIPNSFKVIYIHSLNTNEFQLYNVILCIEYNMIYIMCAHKNNSIEINHLIVNECGLSPYKVVPVVAENNLNSIRPETFISTLHKYQEVAMHLGKSVNYWSMHNLLKAIIELISSN